MLRLAKTKTSTMLGIALATLAFSLPGQAYQGGYNDMGSGSGSGMGMGMGSGSGYSGGSDYYNNRGYGYQRPPMRPYGYQRPPKPMPPMRQYKYERAPMPPMRPYGSQRQPMPPMRPYGYRTAPMAPPAAQAAPSAPAEAATGEVSVSIQGMAYQPASLTVKAGTTVTWTNNDRAPHTVTSMDSGPLASGNMNFGDSYSMTFNEPGTYTYYCKYHPRMRASIIVE